MKLHRIALSNLGALYGAHEVDLDRELRGAPLFLISGLTGSGKSTLLDAVCLALFGRTPRLGREATQEATDLHGDDARRLMSEGTDDALAELEWSRLVRGERTRYRARWRCQRHRTGALSRVTPATRSLEIHGPAGPELLVESARARDYRGPFEAALGGFTLESFLRSMLLAQGEFAAFLEASDRERASILERLTGTGRYDRIGQRVIERFEAVEAVYAAVWKEAEAAGLFEEDARVEEAIASLSREVELARRELAEVDARMAWVRGCGELEAARRAAERQLAALEAEQTPEKRAAFAALEAYEQVEGFRPEHEARARVTSALAGLGPASRELLDAAEVRLEVAVATRAARAERARELGEALEEVREALARARARDRLAAQVAGDAEALARLDQDLARFAAFSEEALLAAPELSAARAQATSLRREAEVARARVVDAPAPRAAALEAERDALLGAIASLSSEIEAMAPEGPARIWSEARAEEDAVAELAHAVGRLARAVAEAPARAGARARVDALLLERATVEEKMREASREREQLRARLEAARLEVRLESLRASLVDGEPCPVCGSRDHPGVEGGPDERGLRVDLERVTARLERLRRQVESLTRALAHAERAASLEPEVEELLLRHVPRVAGARETGGSEASGAEVEDAGEIGGSEASAEVEDAGEIGGSEASAEVETLAIALRAAEAQLAVRQRRLEAARASATELSARLARRERALARLEAAERSVAEAQRAEAAHRDLVTKAETLEASARRADAELDARLVALDLVAPPDPSTESEASVEGAGELAESRDALIDRLAGAACGFSPAVRDNLTALSSARAESHAAAELELAALGEIAATGHLHARLETLEPEVLRAESELRAAEAAWCAAKTAAEAESAAVSLQAAERDRLEAERAALDRALVGVDTAALDCLPADAIPALRAERKALLAARAASISAIRQADDRLEALEASRPDGDLDLERLELERDSASTRLGRALFLLEAETAKARAGTDREALRARLAEAERERATYRRLHALVGRGDELKLFAQSLNLESLLETANDHLSWVAPRYVLVASRDAGDSRLSFTVRDRDLGDAERGVRTLSRGESFLVALALALALAGFEASELKIETLLIDHGFGSLDAESLDRALEVVARLRPSGVQVGLIGHVPELENRIDAKIRIEPVGSGRSRISAPRWP